MTHCTDHRKLNAKTGKDALPLPRIEESLGVVFFNQVDMDKQTDMKRRSSLRLVSVNVKGCPSD